MKKKIKYLYFTLLFSQVVSAQKINYTANKILFSKKIEGQAKLIVFDDKLKMSIGSNPNFAEDSPENVFYNFFKIDSENELKIFFNDVVPKSYLQSNYLTLMKVYKSHPIDNFYELDYKIFLNEGGYQSVFLKYINHNKLFEKPIASIIYLRLINNKWQISDLEKNFELGIFLSCIKAKSLENFLRNKLTQNEQVLLKPYYKNKKLNIVKLAKEFFEIKSKNENHPLVKLIYDNKYSIF
jgi:hypothetical protein